MKRLLILYHSQGSAMQRMAEAAHAGAQQEQGAECVLKRAGDAGLQDLLACHALLVGSPENFGYMAGMVKDFFDRTFYPAQGKVDGLPYAVMIKCSNDGSGALSNIERIARGYPFKKVADAIVVKGELTDPQIEECRELGQTLAAGLALGIF